MSIENWSENIILIQLAREPQMGEELETCLAMIQNQPAYSVVVDFSNVEIVTSSSLAKMLKIRKQIRDNGGSLVLSSVRAQTRKVFEIAGLDQVFEFVDDHFIALAGLQMVES